MRKHRMERGEEHRRGQSEKMKGSLHKKDCHNREEYDEKNESRCLNRQLLEKKNGESFVFLRR